MRYEGGVEAFVRHLDKAKTPLLKAPIVVRGRREKVEIDLALWWNDGYHETMLCFTNNIPQRDGGTHLSAFRARPDAGDHRLCRKLRRGRSARRCR